MHSSAFAFLHEDAHEDWSLMEQTNKAQVLSFVVATIPTPLMAPLHFANEILRKTSKPFLQLILP